MAGLKAEPRALPLEQRPYRNEKYPNYYEKKDLFTSQLRDYEMIDNTVYQAGLKIWLHTQGVESFLIWTIRHPEALRAFKAGLSGEILPEYSLQPRIDPLLPRRYPYRDKHYEYYDDRPNPLEEEGIQGRMAYQLGCKARTTMETKSR